MAPLICLFNTKGMWDAKCAKSPPHPHIQPTLPLAWKHHFGCVPDVKDIIRQTTPSRRQLHKYDRDVWIIDLDELSLSQVSAIILHYWHQMPSLDALIFHYLSLQLVTYRRYFWRHIDLCLENFSPTFLGHCLSVFWHNCTFWNLYILTKQWIDNIKLSHQVDCTISGEYFSVCAPLCLSDLVPWGDGHI